MYVYFITSNVEEHTVYMKINIIQKHLYIVHEHKKQQMNTWESYIYMKSYLNVNT